MLSCLLKETGTFNPSKVYRGSTFRYPKKCSPGMRMESLCWGVRAGCMSPGGVEQERCRHQARAWVRQHPCLVTEIITFEPTLVLI